MKEQQQKKETEPNTNTVITKQTNPTNQPETKKANNNKKQQIKKIPQPSPQPTSTVRRDLGTVLPCR